MLVTLDGFHRSDIRFRTDVVWDQFIPYDVDKNTSLGPSIKV